MYCCCLFPAVSAACGFSVLSLVVVVVGIFRVSPHGVQWGSTLLFITVCPGLCYRAQNLSFPVFPCPCCLFVWGDRLALRYRTSRVLRPLFPLRLHCWSPRWGARVAGETARSCHLIAALRLCIHKNQSVIPLFNEIQAGCRCPAETAERWCCDRHPTITI